MRNPKGGRTFRQAVSFAVTASLVGAVALTVTGCTQTDVRVAVIEKAVHSAVSDAVPQLIGVRTGDVAKALSETPKDAQVVLIPLLIPDLTTAKQAVTASFPDSQRVYFDDLKDATGALAELGRTAWDTWLTADPDAVEYVEISIPVTLQGEGERVSVKVDTDAMRTFGAELETANITLFVETAERLPQWQATMVALHADEYVGQVTGLPASLASQQLDRGGLAQVRAVEPDGDDLYTVTVSYADPADLIAKAAEQATASYGSKTIWGGVSKAEFERRMASVEDDAADGAELTQEKTATVRLTRLQERPIDSSETLEDNLAAQFDQYRAEPEPGSFSAPDGLEEVRQRAVDESVTELDKRAVKEQKRPGTKRLVAGGSGQSITIKTGGGADRHVTFFTWGTSKQVVSAFIKAGKSITVRVPRGDYRLVYARGDSWYGKKHSFGPNGTYREFKTDSSSSGPMKISIKANYSYTITIEGATASGGGIPSGTTDNPFDE